MYALIEELYPICRSITGDGFRETMRHIRDRIPITVHEVPTGTEVFDWIVPKEWNIRDAYVKNAAGERVIDFRKSNLHVVSYSLPVRATMSLTELRPHLHTDPEHPDWVPYRTSYYQEGWGFCLAHRDLLDLPDGEYAVCIDATLAPGSLTYGEYVLAGGSGDEVLISCHCCHPSLCNDNLSGIAVAVALAGWLGTLAQRRLSYRFVFIPGTIGSITWLARNDAVVPRIRHGLVLSCLGDSGGFTYKRSRRGDAAIDRAVEHVLRHANAPYEILPFVPYGYDERQYCSPGFDLPVGCFMRTPNGRFPEYHSSADDLRLVGPDALAGSLARLREVVEILEHDQIYVNQNPHCEPQLGRRGLYEGVTGRSELPGYELALLWVLNLSDGQHSLLDIASRADMPFTLLRQASTALERSGLLQSASPPPGEQDMSPRECGALLLVSNFTANTGYAWRHIRRTFNHLASEAARRGRRTVICYPPPDDGGAVGSQHGEARTEFVDLRHCNSTTLRDLLARHRIEIVYVTDWPSLSVRYVQMRRAGVRHIVNHVRRSGSLIPPPLPKRVLKRVLSVGRWLRPDAFVAVSEHVRCRLLLVAQASPKRVITIYNAAPSPDATEADALERRDPARLPAELAIATDDVVILTAARAHREKGIGTLLLAASELARTGEASGIHFIHCGDGPDWDEFRQVVGQLHLENTVHLLGYRDDLARILPRADIAVVPSVCHEAFSRFALEAMSCGVPVIASRVGGLVELVRDGVDGLLVEPDDPLRLAEAVRMLVSDPDLRASMGNAAAGRARTLFDEDHLMRVLSDTVLGRKDA
jgi:aminopeptidase-like protein/glycosyltransferase involved in cell wall biosynthesis